MKQQGNLDSLVNQLVDRIYTKLRDSKISIDWSKMNCFATIQWDANLEEIKIKCNRKIKKWHEAAHIGLLSHELSHTMKKPSMSFEMAADLDAIERGLGIYLAVERLYAGKYQDHIIRRGKDRYLGYASIRQQLLKKEFEQLNRLLVEMKLIPQKLATSVSKHHDMFLTLKKNKTSIHVDGYEFTVTDEVEDSDVKIIDKGVQTEVYVGETLIGRIDSNH